MSYYPRLKMGAAMKEFMVIVLMGVLAFGASAGELTKRTYSRYFEWESSECSKPSAPYIYNLDEYSRWQAENYVDEVERYISCVEAEAQRDYDDARKKMAAAIEEGRDDAIADAESELDSFISNLAR